MKSLVYAAVLCLAGTGLAWSQNVSQGESVSAAASATPPDYGELIAAKKVPSVYPFQVKVGGQLAAIEGDPQTAVFAKVKDPVSPDAEVEILGVPGMIIINVFKANPDGSVTTSVAPKIIMVHNGTRTRLNESLDKVRPAARALWHECRLRERDLAGHVYGEMTPRGRRARGNSKLEIRNSKKTRGSNFQDGKVRRARCLGRATDNSSLSFRPQRRAQLQSSALGLSMASLF